MLRSLSHLPSSICLAALLVAGCGGGGSGSTDTASPEPASNLRPMQLVGEVPLLMTGTVELIAGNKRWTTALSAGRYRFDARIAETDLLQLVARGDGAQARVVLASAIGTGTQALSQAGADAVLVVEESSALNLTTLSTARYGQLPPEALVAAEFANARSRIDELEAHSVAAALQVLATSPEVAMPGGLDNTLQIAQSATMRSAYADAQKSEARFAAAASEVGGSNIRPSQLGDAVLGTISILSRQGFPVTSLTLRSDGTADLIESLPRRADGTSTDAQGNFNGTFTRATGRVAATWSEQADGSLRVVPAAAFGSDFINRVAGLCTPSNGDPTTVLECLVRSRLLELNVEFKSGGFGRHLVLVTFNTEQTFLTGENPPPPEQKSGTEFALATLPSGYYRFSNSELAGRNLLLPVYAPSAAATDREFGSPPPALNVEFHRLNADGTGTVSRIGNVSLTWSLAESSRVLQVSYSNGHSASFRKVARAKPQPYRVNGEPLDGGQLEHLQELFNFLGFGAREFLLAGVHRLAPENLDFYTGDIYTSEASLPVFTAANVPGRYQQYGAGSEPDDANSEFYFDLFADGSGEQTSVFVCRPEDVNNLPGCFFPSQVVTTTSTLRIFWRVDESGRLVMQRRRLFFDANNTPGAPNCSPVGSSNGQGEVCKLVDERIETLLSQHGSRVVAQESRNFDRFGGFNEPIDNLRPFFITRFYDKAPLPTPEAN